MSNNTARQETLAQITGRSVSSIRHMQAHDYTPWDDSEFEAGKHRRYSGEHALALLLAEMLTKQGVSNEDASEVVRAHQGNAARFLDAVERGETAEQTFVLAYYQAIEDSWAGTKWELDVNAGGNVKQVMRNVENALERVGQVRETRNGRSTERTIGGLHFAIASIPETYRLLKARAEAAGFGIDGRRIYQLEAGETIASEAN